MRGHHARFLREHEAARVRNHELANLVAFAFHDPKKMPQYSGRKKSKRPEGPTEADDAQIRAFFIGLASRG